MTDELRTLKDLHEKYTKDNQEGLLEGMELIEVEHDREHFVQDLKKEASKWVQEIMRQNFMKPGQLQVSGYAPTEIIKWIKMFFNITEADEEDLK